MTFKSMKIPRDDNGAEYPAVRLGETAKVTIGGTSAASAAQHTQVVRVVASCNCHIKRGSDPTATTDDAPLSADAIEYLALDDGDKIAVIQADGESGGTLYITEGR